jgi:hypothetical protein
MGGFLANESCNVVTYPIYCRPDFDRKLSNLRFFTAVLY